MTLGAGIFRRLLSLGRAAALIGAAFLVCHVLGVIHGMDFSRSLIGHWGNDNGGTHWYFDNEGNLTTVDQGSFFRRKYRIVQSFPAQSKVEIAWVSQEEDFGEEYLCEALDNSVLAEWKGMVF